MFSPHNLLHFVFADGNDLYCSHEVLALDLSQHLWLRLHEQGYGCVYYLDLNGDEVSVRTYGDRLAQGFVPDKPIWSLSRQKIINSSLQKWLQRQLTEKGAKRSAVVCELAEFCRFFSGADWKDFFRELAGLSKRTGIIVLTAPPEAEASRSLFLSAPVFDSLREDGITGLRKASPCDLYAALHRNMPDRMLYLNAWTAERLRSMLTRILLEDAKHTVDCDLLPYMTDYLLQWMNNPALRKKDAQTERLLPSPDESFRQAYERLRKEDCWSQLTARAAQVSKAGGIRSYVETLDCALAEDPVSAVCVRRDPNSYAGRCLNLRLKTAALEGEEQAGIRDLLEEIRKQVVAPRNREENPRLGDEVDRLLSELNSADLEGDAGTVRRILYAISFCVHWICVAPKSKEEGPILKVLDKLQSWIELSRSFCDQRQNFANARSTQSLGKSRLTELRLKQMEDKLETTRRMLSNYEDAVQASVVELSMVSAASIDRVVRDLTDELDRQSEDEAARRQKEKSESRKQEIREQQTEKTDARLDRETGEARNETDIADQAIKDEPKVGGEKKDVDLDNYEFRLTDDDYLFL